ncbi:MAG TPA: phage tail protein [Kofleriaceae bacterium]|nr:phage tail protein [Kofleriaceae bacterium]
MIGKLARIGSQLLTLEDPLPAFSFFVSLDPTDAHLPVTQAILIPIMALGAFSEVKGLGGELEVTPYAEGGCNDFVHQLPVRHTWGRITLRRGVIRDMALWVWYLGGLNGSLGARRDGCITVCDEAGDPAVIYVFRRAIATKWIGPDLNAMQSNTAIDGLEIVHEGLTAYPVPSVGLVQRKISNVRGVF